MRYLDTGTGRRLAYRRIDGRGPGVVFLSGFRSDMEGTKAVHLEGWAKARGLPFVRFDYSGHGASDGAFEDGAIGDWAEDAAAVLGALTRGRQVLVGSSMGGWIMLLLARAMPERVAGLVGVAAAPDFTEDDMAPSLTEAEAVRLKAAGRIERPSEYGEPLVITRRLLEEGRSQLVLRSPLPLPFPVRLLHGTADRDVRLSVPLRLMDHVRGEDVRLTFVKGADHRFSSPACLRLIEAAVEDVLRNALH
jgi:pimeloyl-ACP methyl ester carboxylesterase